MTDWIKPCLALLWGTALAVSPPAGATDSQKGLPDGWFVTESAPQLYEAGVDPSTPCEGSRSAYLRSRPGASPGYGTFMQAFGAASFRGKRLRFSAVVRTEDVKGWAGLWMRVEGADPKEPLAFDNMQSRALVGTTACRRYDVVLDVPQEAKSVMAGLLLSGTGKAWIGAVRFETVDTSVPVTDLLQESLVAEGPHTGGLEDRSGDRPTGRIGGVWFDRKQLKDRTYASLLQPDGSWRDNTSGSLKVTEGKVQGTFNQLPVRLTVKSGGPSTLIEGQWGEHPVRIELGPEKLTMKWGFYERELTREEERPEYDRSCIRYRRGSVSSTTDQLDVCGEALSKKPPAVQLVLAFLRNGFRQTASLSSPPSLRERTPTPISSPLRPPSAPERTYAPASSGPLSQ